MEVEHHADECAAKKADDDAQYVILFHEIWILTVYYLLYMLLPI